MVPNWTVPSGSAGKLQLDLAADIIIDYEQRIRGKIAERYVDWQSEELPPIRSMAGVQDFRLAGSFR